MKNKQAFNKHHVMLNLIQHLQRRLLSLRNSERGRSRIKYGMTPNFMGFTLIELLVVVLIIGILAAVALPQYQKAVEKSRAAQAFAMLKTVYNAAEAYHLANGTYATSFDELSVDIPWTGTQGWTNGNPTRSGSDWAVQLYNNSLGTEPAVTVGRLRGKYRGAGFFVYLKDISLGDKTLQGGVTYCAERVMNGDINFSAEDNSYCGQIFKGVLLNSNTSGPLRYYSLP